MNSFLFPKEGNNSIKNYFFAIIFISTGVYLLGAIVMGLCIAPFITLNESFDISTLPIYFSKNQYLVINLIPFILGVITFLVLALYLFKRPFLTFITSRTKIDWRRFLLSFSLWFIVLLLSQVFVYIASPKLLQWNFKADQFLILLLIGLTAVVIQTLFEELLLRGFMLQFGAVFFKKGSVNIVFNALIFGALHAANPEIEKLGYVAIAYYIICGIFEGIISVMDDGFELAWGFHFANNFFVLVLCNTTWGALQTDSLFLDLSEPSASLSALIVPCVTFPLILFLFGKIYKWENWKSKLF